MAIGLASKAITTSISITTRAKGFHSITGMHPSGRTYSYYSFPGLLSSKPPIPVYE